MTEFTLRTANDLGPVFSHIATLDLDKPWVIEIEPWKKKRSGNQNSYYWKCLDIIGRELGHSKDDLHTYFRREHLTPVERQIMGKAVLCLPSTTDLTTAEFATYMDRIISDAAQIGIQLPIPEEA